jgi:hypothetical protein
MSTAIVAAGARTIAPVVAPTARQAATWALKKGGQFIASAVTIGSMDDVYDWAMDTVFGSEEEKQDQADILAEIYTLRNQLNDPSIPNDQKLMLAQRESELQNKLESEYGVSLSTNTGNPQPPVSSMGTPSAPLYSGQSYGTSQSIQSSIIDPEGDGQYTPAEFRKVNKMAEDLATYLRVDKMDLPRLIEYFRIMLNYSETTLKDIIGD